MLPGKTPNYGTNILFGDAKLLRNIPVSPFLRCLGTNRAYAILCQFRFAAIFTYGTIVAAFITAINHIFGTCAQKQVIGITAGWVIAFVANFQRPWRDARCKFVGYATSLMLLAIQPETTIAAPRPCRVPLPAFIGSAYVNLFPKARHEIAARGMTSNKTQWFAFDDAELAMRSWRESSFFATTTVAITVRDFVRGIIGVHKNLHFLCQASERLATLPRRFAFNFRSFILPHLNEYGNVHGRDLLKATGA